VIENNPNKNLIVSGVLSRNLGNQKGEKEKRGPPPILIYSNEGSLKELKW
jgi:hypothetical protein